MMQKVTFKFEKEGLSQLVSIQKPSKAPKIQVLINRDITEYVIIDTVLQYSAGPALEVGLELHIIKLMQKHFPFLRLTKFAHREDDYNNYEEY